MRILVFLWVKLVMKRYSSQQPEMPGTGGELAKHLIERFSLKDVKVEVTELGDHYDPIEKVTGGELAKLARALRSDSKSFQNRNSDCSA